MFTGINLYIARPTYHFILIYTCGLTAVIKRICYAQQHQTEFCSTKSYHSLDVLIQGWED